MFAIKVLLNHLNPKLRLMSINDTCLSGSNLYISRNQQMIRHNGKLYTWEVKSS